MSDLFIEVPITVDRVAISNAAIARIQAAWPGWEGNPGDLEVVILEAISVMAEDAASVAASVPFAVFEVICELLHGILRQEGTTASGAVTFTTTEEVLIPAGTEIDIDGYAFLTDIDASTTSLVAAAVPATATVIGTAANTLAGTLVSLITPLASVTLVTLDSPTSGGTDDETSGDFLDRAVLEMRLQATTLVTLRDYEILCLSQSYVGRVVVEQDVPNKDTVVYPLHADGTVLTDPEKDALEELLGSYRLTNWTLVVTDPNICDVHVTYAVVMYPGFLEDDVVANIDANLELFLDPATWGRPTNDETESTFLAEPVVRKNKLIDVIGGVQGVNYVVSLTLADGGAGSGTVESNGDYTMNGDNPLARALPAPTGTAT